MHGGPDKTGEGGDIHSFHGVDLYQRPYAKRWNFCPPEFVLGTEDIQVPLVSDSAAITLAGHTDVNPAPNLDERSGELLDEGKRVGEPRTVDDRTPAAMGGTQNGGHGRSAEFTGLLDGGGRSQPVHECFLHVVLGQVSKLELGCQRAGHRGLPRGRPSTDENEPLHGLDPSEAIQPHGILGADHAVELRRALVDAVRRIRPPRLIVDLRDLQGLDAIKLGTLAASWSQRGSRLASMSVRVEWAR